MQIRPRQEALIKTYVQRCSHPFIPTETSGTSPWKTSHSGIINLPDVPAKRCWFFIPHVHHVVMNTSRHVKWGRYDVMSRSWREWHVSPSPVTFMLHLWFSSLVTYSQGYVTHPPPPTPHPPTHPPPPTTTHHRFTSRCPLWITTLSPYLLGNILTLWRAAPPPPPHPLHTSSDFFCVCQSFQRITAHISASLPGTRVSPCGCVCVSGYRRHTLPPHRLFCVSHSSVTLEQLGLSAARWVLWLYDGVRRHESPHCNVFLHLCDPMSGTSLVHLVQC